MARGEVIVYSFLDEYDESASDWTTFSLSEAKQFAIEHEYKLVENTYEWADSEVIADYTVTEEEEEEEEEEE